MKFYKSILAAVMIAGFSSGTVHGMDPEEEKSMMRHSYDQSSSSSNELIAEVSDSVASDEEKRAESSSSSSSSAEGAECGIEKAQDVLIDVIKKGDLECVDLLIRKGADINHRYCCDFTPLLMAVHDGQTAIVNRLLSEKECDLLAVDGVAKENALMWASRMGHVDIVEILIETKKIDIEAVDAENSTALILSILMGNIDVMDRLILAGAKAQGELYNDVFFIAIDKIRACTLGMIDRLICQGANIYAVDEDGNTPLIHICGSRLQENEDIIKEIADRFMGVGMDVNAQNKDGENALIQAVRMGRVCLIHKLLDSKVDATARNLHGENALKCFAAIVNRYIRMIEIAQGLHGTAIRMEEMRNNRLLQYAVIDDQNEIVQAVTEEDATMIQEIREKMNQVGILGIEGEISAEELTTSWQRYGPAIKNMKNRVGVKGIKEVLERLIKATNSHLA